MISAEQGRLQNFCVMRAERANADATRIRDIAYVSGYELIHEARDEEAPATARSVRADARRADPYG